MQIGKVELKAPTIFAPLAGISTGPHGILNQTAFRIPAVKQKLRVRICKHGNLAGDHPCKVISRAEIIDLSGLTPDLIPLSCSQDPGKLPDHVSYSLKFLVVNHLTCKLKPCFERHLLHAACLASPGLKYGLGFRGLFVSFLDCCCSCSFKGSLSLL